MLKFLTPLFILPLLLISECRNANEQNEQDKKSDLSNHGRLKVSENQRFLVFEDGTPFFYLGDTAWELFHRLNRKEVDYYLENRSDLGFTVIQAVILAELNGLIDPNPYGHVPLVDMNPKHPNESYFEHVDYIINRAAQLGLFVAVLPSWGDKWNKKRGQGPEIFTPENAYAFGEFLGKRYEDTPNIIWVVGGDRPIENDTHRQIVVAMAQGLRNGDNGNHLITYHSVPVQGSAEIFHDEDWLDFNMRQTGHNRANNRSSQAIRSDYNREPVKPAIDGEPIYEDHPIAFRKDEHGHSVAADVRKIQYINLFNGAFGITYGHHSVWQMWQEGRHPITHPLLPWYDALYQPGAAQMQYVRWLIESRPFLSRIPDDSMIVPHKVTPSAVPGAGEYRFAGTRDTDSTYAMIYVPVGRDLEIQMDIIKGEEVVAWWYNPRNGSAEKIGAFPNTGTQKFIPPAPGERLDWVLVLDDAEKRYKTPGKR